MKTTQTVKWTWVGFFHLNGFYEVRYILGELHSKGTFFNGQRINYWSYYKHVGDLYKKEYYII